ncbi:MAG: hypothetical protein CSA42_00065, partial [Gammaproteobacteria bacterium]
MPRILKTKQLNFFLILIILAIGSAIVLLCCTPPMSRDALTHHLYVPSLYILHGGIYEIPEIEFSYFPMNLDLLYAIPLFFNNDSIPKFIHFFFAIATAVIIYRYIKKRINSTYALLACIFFLSTPIIIKLSITVYVDLGLIFFSTGALLLLFEWVRNPENNRRYLILSAVFCGLAAGTKYNGLIVLFLLTCFVPLIFTSSNRDNQNCAQLNIRYCLYFFFIALFVFSPWLIRNTLWTNNPLYPLYDNFFNPANNPLATDDKQIRLGIFKLRELLYGESALQIFLLPIRVFFEGQDNIPQYFDGKLNPFLLLLPLFAFFNKNKTNEKFFLALYSILTFLFVLFTTNMRIRYISAIV